MKNQIAEIDRARIAEIPEPRWVVRSFGVVQGELHLNKA
jgi:hypothetical protein